MLTKFLLTLLYVPTICSFISSMHMSNNYLHNLEKISKTNLNKFENKLKDAQLTNMEQINVDSIFLNVYKLDTVFFNRNSKNVMFQLRHNMENIYYIKDDNIMKLSNNTNISSKNIRKFVITELSEDVDALLYNNNTITE
jgi:hypothetical protein